MCGWNVGQLSEPCHEVVRLSEPCLRSEVGRLSEPCLRARVVVFCLALLAIFLSPAQAQPTGTNTPPESHGWMGVPTLDDEDGSGTLLHLPPRGSGPGAGGERPTVEAGTGHALRQFETELTAVASWDRRVYLLFASWADRLEVFSLRVFPAGVSGAWLTDPASGASAEPSLVLDGAAFVEAAACAEGLLVLARVEAETEHTGGSGGGGGGGGGWRLWRLGGQGWELLSLPEGIAGSEQLRLVVGSPEPMVMTRDDTVLVRWVLARQDDDEAWTSAELAGTFPVEFSRVLSVFVSGGDVCAVFATTGEGGEQLAVRSLGPGLVGRIASMALEGRPITAVPLEAGRRLAVLFVVDDKSTNGELGGGVGESAQRWEIVELSLATGRELYRGPLQHPKLAIGNEMRLLSVLMMAMSAFILFYLLRPVDGEAGTHAVEPRLPEGFALAEPGRRLAGGVVDAVFIAWLVSLAFGIPLHKFFLLPTLFEDARGMLAFMAFVVGGALYGTLTEWLFGRSLGKVLLGMRVVSVDPRRPRDRAGVGLMRSGARNVFRWALAPWAIAGMGGMGSPDHRHRGDRLTGAAVVISVSPAEPEQDKGQDEGDADDGPGG